MISSQFQLIASQCRSSQVAVTNALNSLAANQLFIPAMLSQGSLNSQIDILVGEVKNDTLFQQQQCQNLIHTINQQNQLASGLSNSFLYANVNDTNQFYLVQ